MILLTKDEIIELHKRLIDKTGGSYGIRDNSLLESAIYSAVSAFENNESYPTIEEKAARLMFALTNNHSFVDGNKRIGVLTTLITLQLNDVKIKYSQKELISLGLSVAEGQTEYIEILNWIKEHKI